MLLLPLLSVAVGMTISASTLSDAFDNQKDTVNIVPIEAIGCSSDSSNRSKNESRQLSPDGQTNQSQPASMSFEMQAAPSKKNVTVVKKNNEATASTLVDSHPLLTEIMSYDPLKFRVWPREPRVIPDQDLIDSLRIKPLFLPLVFSLHSPDYPLRGSRKINHSSLLSTPKLDSLMDYLDGEHDALQFDLQTLRKLESSMIRNVRYTKNELPEADPLVFILKQEKPMLLENSNLKIAKGSNDKGSNYPQVAYNPWSKRGYFQLHFSETYLSPNWSNGGESNMAGMAAIYLEANYNDLKNVQFDNSLELKIGMNTVSTDTLRNLNVSSDQLRALSKLGIRMHNNWYYSLSSEFVTQTLNNYRKNTTNLQASFLSPAKLFISLGMDFKKTDSKKGYNLSVMLSPLTYKANYLYDNKDLDPKSYGIDPGKHIGSEFGSKVSSTISWKFSEKLTWKSKIYYFSDYTYVDSEWENTCDISLNNYFSTQIYLYAKMDDRMKRKPGESLIQLQQLLSFGMTYRF